MAQPAEQLSAEDFEFDEEAQHRPLAGAPVPSRSPYHLPRSEQLRGVANRIIFSRYYILYYAVMMGLSLTTVVLSLIATHKRQCPPVVWHILEIVVNGMMVLEVGTRWTAYGKKYPMTLLNVVDLLLVLFCSLTLILVFSSPCAEGTRQEEVLDTILLVIRNAVQFLRLGNILRRSGHSLFNPPKPIDLTQAGALNLDLDLDDEEAQAERHLSRTLVGSRPGAGGSGGYERLATEEPARRPLGVANNAGRDALTEEDEEAWDRLG